jgi:two-component system, NtrC family, sensor kinase
MYNRRSSLFHDLANWNQAMTSTAPCVQCGELTELDRDDAVKSAICAQCLARSAVTSSGTFSGFLSSPPLEASDRIVTRSMLIQIPGMHTVPADEMICRLEPVSLRWLDVSESLRDFLGQSLELLSHQSFTQYLHQDDRSLAEEEFRQVCEIGERYDLVLRLKSRTGHWHYIRISSQARYELDGRANHIRCNLRDVTQSVRAEHELRRRTQKLIAANEQLRQINLELQQTQAQLIHSEKLAALGTLTAGMAHEINNPLAFAVNNLAILQRDVGEVFKIVAWYEQITTDLHGSRPELSAAIARFRDESDLTYLEENLPRIVHSTYKGLIRVAQIVEKLRGFARIDRAESGEFDINVSIDQCLTMLNETMSRLRITVARRFVDVPPIEGAVADLNQVFLDLLANSARAIEDTGRDDGRIEIETERAGDDVVIEIRDNGCGISPEVIPKIFDPFFTTKPLGEGMGLGLSVSYGIIAKHGGRIEVSSQPGQGSCFRVVLTIEPVCIQAYSSPIASAHESST